MSSAFFLLPSSHCRPRPPLPLLLLVKREGTGEMALRDLVTGAPCAPADAGEGTSSGSRNPLMQFTRDWERAERLREEEHPFEDSEDVAPPLDPYEPVAHPGTDVFRRTFAQQDYGTEQEAALQDSFEEAFSTERYHSPHDDARFALWPPESTAPAFDVDRGQPLRDMIYDFLSSTSAKEPLQQNAVPAVTGIPPEVGVQVKERATVVARQLAPAEEDEDYIESQVEALLSGLSLEDAEGYRQIRAGGHLENAWENGDEELERAWKHEPEDDALAQERQKEWDEVWGGFDEVWDEETGAGTLDEVWGGMSKENLKSATAEVVDVLTRNKDPKFQNSKFVRFMKEISTGEVELKGDRVVPGTFINGQEEDEWWQEYEHERSVGDRELHEYGEQLYRAGHLRDAYNVLEEETQRHPENSRAWHLLGLVHQERDEDLQSIACLQRAYEADTNNADVLLALGVSYANEAYSDNGYARSLGCLRSWLDQHPRYALLDGIQKWQGSDDASLEDVIEMFLEAARSNPGDANVHMALGVLFNLSSRYNDAADAFRRALDQSPDDHSLWNKLGATLANGRRSNEAVPAYHKALDLRPDYVRALANMGIAYGNMGEYGKAARSYLSALARNSKADHIWGCLDMTFASMSRIDLFDLSSRRDLSLFRNVEV